MPELPEVETVRRGITQIQGEKIVASEVLHPRVLRHQQEGKSWFFSQINENTIIGVARRGKYLWLAIDNDLALVMHLGMSGQIILQDAIQPDFSQVQAMQFASKTSTEKPGDITVTAKWLSLAPSAEGYHKHLRAKLYLASGKTLDFVDQRTFGFWHLCPYTLTSDGKPGGLGEEKSALPTAIAHIARDALDDYINIEKVIVHMRKSHSAIKTVLINQTIMSGIGNIYVDEACGRAKIHPATPASQLKPRALKHLILTAQTVMQEALMVGGTSFDALYVNVQGEPGWFARELYFYGRAGQICKICLTEETSTVLCNSQIAGRNSVWCPTCQKC